MYYKTLATLALCSLLFLSSACATKPYDYTAYRAHFPSSILVLPPVNQSPDQKASHSFWSQTMLPLAESGYYVFPLTLVQETFRHNGLSTPEDIQSIAPDKLQKIFGADAALYITITDYGARYQIIASETRVTAEAKLVDLKTGTVLWTGKATASNREQEGHSPGGGLAVVLVGALLDQMASQIGNTSHKIAAITSQRLLSAKKPPHTSLLFGPRSPYFNKN